MQLKSLFYSFQSLALACGVAVIACLFVTGCGKKDAAADAIEADANGYLCQKCQAKFYTERSVFAEFCPACKASEIQQVVCLVCDKDGQTAVLPRTKGAIPCVKCQAPMASIRLARETDLQPWGAVKKARAEVSRH